MPRPASSPRGSYENRLQIWNPGELPEGWTEELLLAPHPSQPFNPDIANAFFRAGEIEAWGRGIQRIFDACRQAGTPEPRLQVQGREFWFEFRFPATTQETTQERIVRILRLRPETTRKELADRLGLTSDGVKYHLDRLRRAGVIRHHGPTKAGRWEILKDLQKL